MDPFQPPIKTLHLITLLELGGAQGNTLYTVQHLNPQKFEAHLWSGQGAYWDESAKLTLGNEGRLRFFPYLIRDVSVWKDAVVLFQLWKEIKKFNPAILHTHSSKAGILGRLAGWLAGVPLIIHTFHGFGFNDQQKPWTRFLFVLLERLTAPLATRLVFVSKSNIETAKKERIGKERQYVLIRSGVPLKKILSEARGADKERLKSNLQIPLSAKIVCTVGPFKPQKNLTDFIEMARKVRDRYKDVFFVLVGDGELRPTLEKKIADLNLADAVRLAGWRKDVSQILSISDVFVMTSLWEGLPRSLVEAMNLGVPPVCYDTDGVRDLLAGLEGSIVGQKDKDALARRVIELLENEALAKSVSTQIRALIGAEFDIDGMVQQQEELYGSLLSNRDLTSR